MEIFDAIPEELPNAVHKCKAYDLIKPMRRNTGYWLDITEKGLMFLEYKQIRLTALLKAKTLKTQAIEQERLET